MNSPKGWTGSQESFTSILRPSITLTQPTFAGRHFPISICEELCHRISAHFTKKEGFVINYTTLSIFNRRLLRVCRVWRFLGGVHGIQGFLNQFHHRNLFVYVISWDEYSWQNTLWLTASHNYSSDFFLKSLHILDSLSEMHFPLMASHVYWYLLVLISSRPVQTPVHI